MTFILVLVAVALVISFFFSWFFKDEKKEVRTIANCIIILLVAIFGCVAVADHGMFGNPYSLNHKTYYKVLSVTPIDEKSTVVILRDGNHETVPIKFAAQISADTNGFYTLVGYTYENYTLAPIK